VKRWHNESRRIHMDRPLLSAPARGLFCLSFVLVSACGGRLEDPRTDGSEAPNPGATVSDPRVPPSVGAASPSGDASMPPGDPGRCDLRPTKVRLVPHSGNSARCERTETCELLAGHGAHFFSCSDGIASRPQYWAECSETTCSCSADSFDVFLAEGGHAFDSNELRTCSYFVERVN
jgi:hypothetical protein